MRRRIAVLMGGVSAEREVSLKSGKGIAEALRQKGHEVHEVDIAEESIAPALAVRPELAFIALHGRFGEDGAIQGLLEEAGIAYTGSDPQASRAGMDKMASKCFFITHDVPTPPFRLLTTTQSWEKVEAAIEEIGLPLIVKPLRQGSSYGVSLAKTREQVATGLAEALKYGQHAPPRAVHPGREFTVGILDQAALPVMNCATRTRFSTSTPSTPTAARSAWCIRRFRARSPRSSRNSPSPHIARWAAATSAVWTSCSKTTAARMSSK